MTHKDAVNTQALIFDISKAVNYNFVNSHVILANLFITTIQPEMFQKRKICL